MQNNTIVNENENLVAAAPIPKFLTQEYYEKQKMRKRILRAMWIPLLLILVAVIGVMIIK